MDEDDDESGGGSGLREFARRQGTDAAVHDGDSVMVWAILEGQPGKVRKPPGKGRRKGGRGMGAFEITAVGYTSATFSRSGFAAAVAVVVSLSAGWSFMWLKYRHPRRTAGEGTIRFGVVWHETVLYATCTAWHGMKRYGAKRYETVWHLGVQYETIRVSTNRCETVRAGKVRHGTV